MDGTLTDGVFRSILWPGGEPAGASLDDVVEPDCFHDLNLDQLVAAIDRSWPGENLAPFFRLPLASTEAVVWRQDVLRDLQQAPLRQAITAFVERLRDMRERLAHIEKLFYPIEKQRAHLGAADVYCRAVAALSADLVRLQPASSGLRGLQSWVGDYIASVGFTRLRSDGDEVLAALDGVHYDLLVRTGSVTVRADGGEPDASTAVQATFAKFRPEASDEPRPPARGRIGFNGLNHIEAQVLDKIVLLHPLAFELLAAFADAHDEFIDATLDRFSREICFYLAWLAYLAPMQAVRLAFCFPVVDPDARTIAASDAFDIALAAKLAKEHRAVVCNGFELAGDERMLVVTGPNHGGKTTFARAFGQLHWLAALGLTVPGTQARLLLFDRLFTHFERVEAIETLRGKLKDDLVRIRAILDRASPRSLIVMNEIFSSTTLDDALALARRMLGRIAGLGALAVCVTFLTELAEFDAHTASMVAEIDPRDPTIRTFRVTRRPADGLAYALAVANKHRVTREWLLKRIAP